MLGKVVFVIATNVGMVLDKYILQTTSATKKFFRGDYALPKGGWWEVSTLLGYPIGMILFGPLSDVIGRRACMITTSVMTFVGALGSACAWNIPVLIACRVIIGIGAGGEYPLAAVHTSEGADEKKNAARNVGFLYFSASVGTFLAPLVALILLQIYPTDPDKCPGVGCDEDNNQKVWRGTFGFAAVVAFIGLVLRILTTRDAHAERRREMSSNLSVVAKYWKPLLSTAFSWFFYDIVEYGLKNNQVDILDNGEDSVKHSLEESLLTNSIALAFILIASFAVTQFATKWCQMFGFGVLVCVNGIIAFSYAKMRHSEFVVFYIAQSAMQAFPGVTTIAIPAEIFPTQVKGTCHGISAMTGKFGAIFGSKFFATIESENVIFAIVSASCVIGVLTTALLTPKYRHENLTLMEEKACQGDALGALATLYDRKPGDARTPMVGNEA